MSISSEVTRITNAKAAIKTAIEGKGVTVPDGTKLDGMAALIESISSGGSSNLWGGKFTTGSFILAEETTSEYIIASNTDEAMLGLLNEGESLTDQSVYGSIGLLVVRKPTAKFSSSSYQNCVGSSMKFPTRFGNGAGYEDMTQYWGSYGSPRADTTGVATASFDRLSMKFTSSYKGSPDFTYQWVAWRGVI